MIEKPTIQNYESFEKAKDKAKKYFRRLSDAIRTMHY